MLNQKLFDDISARVQEMINQTPARDLQKNLRATLQSVFGRLDLVTREEFDVQQEVLARTREKLNRMELRLAELERMALGPSAVILAPDGGPFEEHTPQGPAAPSGGAWIAEATGPGTARAGAAPIADVIDPFAAEPGGRPVAPESPPVTGPSVIEISPGASGQPAARKASPDDAQLGPAD